MLLRVHALFLFFVTSLLFPMSPVSAQPITVTSWNMEWLSSSPSARVKESQRDDEDFKKLAYYFQTTATDLLAFQEVNDINALRKVVGKEYQILLSDRANPRYQRFQFDDINQYTGFAIRKGLPYRDVGDVQLNKGNSKLRFASYVVIGDGPHEIHVLNVHLKAGCSGTYKSSDACKTLKNEGQELSKWIVERQKLEQRYMVLGDFNHNLAHPNDWLMAELANKGDLLLLTAKTAAKCKVRSKKNPDRIHSFRSLIDHIAVSDGLSATQANQTVFSSQDVLQYQLSDHCPVSTTLTLP
ncbi:TPA: endonuclease/exonuclease/phosphatase family protein [Vibrio vulnificus]|nr:endonuclease/exonuclease/phosphatase family protein [Vibrio sp. 05-20-BW147]HAS6347081.1 endonuclease/exonuclease/phosphatase family protein [Vibrio vulnificus]